ncbi:hypothetical protein PAXRUDRAFT_18455 [Paxillus rubicundulus Ve08.2h10]|uniref:Uncharacterized protein n=1 Tax=Paxillus rubicundulus Ve08.2h10 TaxID=930991 RepID=A0A0D0CY07_9AGAM|nr:hypothetical protein PAXRUDRAFT_18455 [Paxillus rubicundulus Ve08.2h10]
MPPSVLSALLAQSAPSAPKKQAKQVTFEVATAHLHTLALTLLGDANNLVEEQDMWSDESNISMDVMAGANAGAIAEWLTLWLPSWKEAADCLEAEAWAHAGSPMVEAQ